jgi:mycothiol synthase
LAHYAGDIIMPKQLEVTTEYGLPDTYTARGATLDDLPEAVAMFNAVSQQALGVNEFSVEAYRPEWAAPNLNLPEYVKIVQASDGRIVGCVEVWDQFEPHTRINAWIKVHPEHQARGIETALLRFAEDKARQSAIPRAPAEARVSLFNAVNDREAATNTAYVQSEYHLVRNSYLMQIELSAEPPAPIWPDGIKTRSFVPGQDEAAVVQVEREAFRDHWGFIERPFEDDVMMIQHRMDGPDFDPALWLMATVPDEQGSEHCIGYCRNRTQAPADVEMGWVGSLGVMRAFRRQGLATALLLQSFGEFYRRGKKRVGLGVDAQNLTGALRLYERVGMHVARKYNTFEKELRSGVELSTQKIA